MDSSIVWLPGMIFSIVGVSSKARIVVGLSRRGGALRRDVLQDAILQVCILGLRLSFLNREAVGNGLSWDSQT